jgi:hypothetical protein
VYTPAGEGITLLRRSNGPGRINITLPAWKHLEDIGAEAGDELTLCREACKGAPGGRLVVRVAAAAARGAAPVERLEPRVLVTKLLSLTDVDPSREVQLPLAGGAQRSGPRQA